MAALIALLYIAFLPLRQVNLSGLADDCRFKAATTLFGTERSGDGNSERDDSGHNGFTTVSI
jgi:hypothetical protein